MTNDLFSLLKNTVRVLIVDDEPVMCKTLEDYFDFFPIYSVSTASSTVEALAVLKRNKSRFHVCVMDRGLSDVQKDEFYLIDKYRKEIPFVVITGRQDSEKGFECGEHGAKMVISKGAPGFVGKVVRSVNDVALKSIVIPGFHESPAPFLCRCMELLMEKNPLLVKDLARSLHMSDKALRNSWKKYLGIDPKYSLCIFHLYAKAFECVEKEGRNGNGSGLRKCAEEMFGSRDAEGDCGRFGRYYLKNRQLIESFVRNPSGLID